MPPILVLELAAALAAAAPSPSATGRSEGREQAVPSSFREAARNQAPAREPTIESAGAARRGTFCTLRIMRADPRLDRGMVVAMDRPVDSAMVVPSTCAAE